MKPLSQIKLCWTSSIFRSFVETRQCLVSTTINQTGLGSVKRYSSGSGFSRQSAIPFHIIILLIYTCISINALGQPNWIHTIDSFQTPLKVIPVVSANSLLVDSEQNILLLDPQKSLIYKYLSITQYDSSIVIGGKGKGREAITQATKMSMPNRQQLYILDEAQSRLLLMNINFKLLRNFDFLQLASSNSILEELEIFPQSFSVNSFSELYVLNQLDAKVYQFDAKNELVRQFGGLAYGAGSLTNPVDVQAHIDQRVYVSDTLAQSITVFSNYGLYLYTLSSDTILNWKRFHLFEKYIIYVTPNSIYIQYLPTRELIHLPLALASPLLDVYFTKDFIYLLFEGAIHIYSITD